MAKSDIFHGRHLVVALRNVQAIMDVACTGVGDMSLVEYTYLVSASEFDAGLSLKRMQVDFGGFQNQEHYINLLEEKELAQRVRNCSDRRGFALKTTAKGRFRISLVDKAIAAALIASSKQLSEQSFDHLVAQLSLFSAAHEPQRRVLTFFPGVVLLLVCKYHQLVVQESAFLGMTSFQTSTLCVLDYSDGALSSAQLARRLGVQEDIMDLQLNYLEESHSVRGENAFELTEEGRERTDRVARRLSARLDAFLDELSEADLALLESLSAYCAYLFV